MPSPPAAKDAASRPPVTSAVPESSSGLDDAPPDPPGPVPRPSPRRRLDVANGVFPKEATPDDDDATDARSETAGSDPPGSEKQHSFRERLWEYLLGNMVRAVDEAYFLCELECGAAEIDAAANLLAASSNDFRELAATLRDQEAYAASPGGARSISWDVGRTTARPSEDARAMISAIVGPPRVGPGPDDGAPGAPSTSRSPDRSKKKKSPIAAATMNDDARGGGRRRGRRAARAGPARGRPPRAVPSGDPRRARGDGTRRRSPRRNTDRRGPSRPRGTTPAPPRDTPRSSASILAAPPRLSRHRFGGASRTRPRTSRRRRWRRRDESRGARASSAACRRFPGPPAPRGRDRRAGSRRRACPTPESPRRARDRGGAGRGRGGANAAAMPAGASGLSARRPVADVRGRRVGSSRRFRGLRGGGRIRSGAHPRRRRSSDPARAATEG